MCGATLAADQLYCVECGQRCGPSRLPFTPGSAHSAKPAPTSEARPRRLHASVNATLIAGVGTLLLALGIGILIGRLGNGSTSTKSPAVQVVTVAGAGGAGTAAGAAGSAAGAPGAESQAGASGTATTPTPGAAAGKSAKAPPKAAVPPAKVVKVGSKGSGPGYQHGHFTGNFFGE